MLKKFLVFLGKPFYFLLTAVLNGIIFLTKVGEISITLPKIKLPKIKLPKVKTKKRKPLKIGLIIRVEELKFLLFELKILTRIGSFFTCIWKIIHNRKLIFRTRIVAPILFILLLIMSFYFLILKDLPSPKDLEARDQEVSTKILDRNGNLLYNIYKDKNRTIIPFDKVPNNVRLATLAAEDAEFYSHSGFSVKGIFRAIIQDLQTGSVQGGSTITQQLVKNTLLTPEKTITRKVKELILSVEVETRYTKDQIFGMYLNEVSYGGTAYGIEEASRSYFGKKAIDLDLAEAAFLAGLTKSPTTYSPFGANKDLAFERQKEVLKLMEINKFISHDERVAAENEKLVLTQNRTEIKAPHFVMYIRQLLVNKYGEDMVEKGGLEVTTSLDLSIQTLSENVVKNEVEKLRGLHVGNGAALVINPQTGEILAMVGSKDYFDIQEDGNVNVLTSLRSPGSSIKIVNYSYALVNNYSAASIIDDSPITYSVPGQPPYSPKNYDGKFKGHVSLRTALAESRNIPAVKVLASYGVTKMIDQGKKMGISTWDNPNTYGLSLTLGGGAVTALDLSKVYSVIANYGKRPDLLPILEVKNYKGKVLEKNTPELSQVIDPRVAFILTDILKDNNARAPEFGFNSYLNVKNHPEVAVKTGTSNDLRDNWAAGYNQNYLVITWVGNNDNGPMSRVASGVTGASPIWNKIMSGILENVPSIDWKIPEGVSKVNICSLTATLPCNSCPTKQEWFLDEVRPTKYCLTEQIQKILATPQPNQILENGINTTFSQ